MKERLLIIALLVACNCLPATAQYNYSYGDSRVVNQSQNGLAQPSSSYIGPGTMSKSAQGLPPGGSSSMANPTLPRVNMGANIRTPGDNLYQPRPSQTAKTPGLLPGSMGANVGTPGDNMRTDLNYYTPGQNQKTNQNPNQPPKVIYKSGSGGVATYADQGYDTSKGSNARRF